MIFILFFQHYFCRCLIPAVKHLHIVILTLINDNTPPLAVTAKHYGNRVGPLATIRCKPRQARKGATVAADSCAGMWLIRLPPISSKELSLQ